MGNRGRIGVSRWVRRGVVPAAAAGALVLGLGGLPSANASGGGGAHKLSLTQTNRGCDGAQIGQTQQARFGFVNMIATGERHVVANVVLKGARPNTTYSVRVIQLVPGDADCSTVDATLTTDPLGNGHVLVHETVLDGATGAWVAVNNQADFTQFYATATTPMSHRR
ncbi:hypothetical protein SAMN05216199_2270 [Pedococcus cremeus]|uniref:Uncharacterized protein n=1 Tax=Pedococcus cremeus TaxID=587636 RepID=A0A1H9V2X7_9MICO|nr:hypothetical protein SAMN05216199_2270 [Pedococcus cremeus]